MSEMVERVARAMYLDRVDPNSGVVTLAVAVWDWGDLPDDSRPGLQFWLCKKFWRQSARAAIAAMREPTGGMECAVQPSTCGEGDDHWNPPAETWRAMIDTALE